jgi:BirA family transcriptional regulator, biotin operon repressor / biotin---[acetyl-CoA-carboxylase] ligase
MIAFAGGALDPTHWRSFQNLGCLAATASSNTLARELVDLYFEEDQALPSTVLVAEEQVGARGRGGKRWTAPAGKGLYLTFVRRVEEGEPISLVPIAVARWLRDAIAGATGVDVRLKWPNDLYVGRRKLAGLLSEARTQGEDTYVAIGIGLNVLGTAASVGVNGATTLEEEAGHPFDLAALLQEVLDRLDRELVSPDWASEVGRWQEAAAHHKGDAMRVRRNGEELEGEYQGLTAEGFLRLKTGSGDVTVMAGELLKW